MTGLEWKGASVMITNEILEIVAAVERLKTVVYAREERIFEYMATKCTMTSDALRKEFEACQRR